MNIGNLLEKQLGFAALKLHQGITEHTSEKLPSDMDRWKSTLAFPLESFVHIGSSSRFNKYGCEFGMGKAVAVRSGCGTKYDGKIAAYPGRGGGRSIDLEVCLFPEFMEALESDQEFMSLVSTTSS